MRNFKRILSMVMVFAMVFSSLSFIQSVNVYGAASELFFSEYIEGSSNNKALEIYNGTGSEVDLSPYTVELYYNGSTSAGSKITLSGMLANNDVYVLANSSAVAAVKNLADLTSTVVNFNGDDAVVLKKSGAIIDVIGQIGNDPGTEWGSELTSTADNTLVRKSTIATGDTNPNDLFLPSAEWEGYAADTFVYLGSHTMTDSGKTAKVTSTPPAGQVLEGTEITLASSTEGATVYCAVYYSVYAPDYEGVKFEVFDENEPIVINEPLKIKAYASKEGLEDSDISEFEYSLIPGASLSEAKNMTPGSAVIVEGKVTTVPGSFGGKSFYMQDGTGGALIYPDTLDIAPAIGNAVRVVGTTKDYNGKFEIIPQKIEIIDTGTAEPDAKAISLGAVGEENEGILVKLSDVRVQKIESDSYKNATITITAGTVTGTVRLDSRTGYSSDNLTMAVGDLVNITGIVEQSSTTSYRVMLRDIYDITASTNEDVEAPVILHTPVSAGHISQDLAVSAEITDDKQVTAPKLYYRLKGTEAYAGIAMSAAGNLYSAAIPKSALSTSGIQYYIEATDGINTATSPADISVPYEVAISDGDILGPQITAVAPANNAILADTEVRPAISAAFSDASGIDASSAKLFIDGTDVTTVSAVQESGVSYQPVQELSLGKHTVLVQVSDKLGNKAEYTWTFMIGEIQYNHFYGQLHSHTGEISDGQGTLDEAYTWARDEGDADFFAVTDHSNWLDNDTASENITDISQSASSEWKLVNSKADQYNKDGEFVAIAGFEMTWSGSTGGWGHINTFNTPWFVSRSNSSMDLESYYSRIAADTASISQLNHPGKTFGDFADFGYYSKEADAVVNLIEVGNGEGAIGSSGYFPSYEYYTRALDKGWHVAPTNNQDNHKAGWITANDARTVVLSTDLTRSSIYEAIRSMRVYATEDKNQKINYKVNRNAMGSILDSPDKLEVYISVEDPDSGDGIGEISIVSNGGTEVASKTFDGNTALWELELDPQYSYYYVRVDQEDGDIAVTAPVWTGEVVPVGISAVEVSQDPQIVNNPVDISATVYNNGSDALYNVMVEFYRDSIAEGNKLGDATIISIPAGSTGKAAVRWTAEAIGSYNLYARTVINVGGAEKVFSGSTAINICNPEDVIKVVLDRAHYNAYISGDYADKDLTLRAMLKDRKYMLVENNDELTASDLENTRLLIITDPQGTDKSDTLKKSLFTDAEVAAIKGYMDNGGSLILCSKADYKDGTGDYSNGVQLNKILEAIAADLRVNDDEVVDNVSNGGQPYRLYFDRYTSSKYGLTEGILEGTTYSFYSGASVIQSAGGDGATIDWLVKGHETTETMDSDYQGDNVPVAKGDVNAIGAELLDSGAKLIVAGTIFFSDFETASNDNAYSNKQITDNILDWMVPEKEIPLKTIAEVRADSDNDGVPDLMGEKFAVEGIVTAQSEAVTPKNAFFEVIYVQDDTGGITVFGVSATPLPLGARVRITGTVGQYDGDAELSVGNEAVDVKITGSEIIPVEPRLMSTGYSMLEANEGWLVKVQGKVTRMSANSIYLDDGTGEARVYVNGYIGDGTGNADMLGKWDASIAVGDTASAVGLASEDPEGHRLRVRITGEIVKQGSKVTGVSLDKTAANLAVNEKLTLISTVQPRDAFNKNVVWSSSNTAAAKVENGVVTATGRGTAVITVTTEDGGYTATCNISVKGVYVPVKGILLNRTEAEVRAGRTVTLKAVVFPGNATHKEVVWSSSDTGIATVANGIVTGISGGTAVITAETADGGYKATCNVKVDGSPVKVKGVLLNRQLEFVRIGRTLELKAIVLPLDAADKTVEWSSSDTRIATVENGVVTAKAAGMTVIKAKTRQGGFTAYCYVFVTKK
ncbi:MAG TPA: CehA/McbA family metallohydrolase [Negativicutes bacterium]|nr:CehA/McbA family metallohydrolase [Negativicutes bacterium]